MSEKRVMRHASWQYLVTTPVKAGTCPRCKTPVLTGWAEGLRARVDLAPLNRQGEIAALLANLATYTLTRSGLIHRDASRIAGNSLKGPTLAQHQCERTVPAEHRQHTAPAATEGIPF